MASVTQEFDKSNVLFGNEDAYGRILFVEHVDSSCSTGLVDNDSVQYLIPVSEASLPCLWSYWRCQTLTPLSIRI